MTSSAQPPHHRQLVTVKSPLSTLRHQVAAGTTHHSWPENWAGGQANRCAEQRRWLHIFPLPLIPPSSGPRASHFHTHTATAAIPGLFNLELNAAPATMVAAAVCVKMGHPRRLFHSALCPPTLGSNELAEITRGCRASNNELAGSSWPCQAVLNQRKKEEKIKRISPFIPSK